MKKLHLCLLFSLLVVTASAQKVYFIYIQTESEQPFFVKMKEKVQSSTASGYIILSRLLDSTYSFSIGFPQGKWSEQKFSVTVGKKDHGYLLKNFGDKGWGLFDLQTLAVQMSAFGNAFIEEKKIDNKDVSGFTEILSKAADDPSLKEKTVQTKVEEKKSEVVIQEKKQEPALVEKSKIETKEEPVTIAPAVTETVSINKDVVPVTQGPKEVVAIKPLEKTEQPVTKQEEKKAEIVQEIKPVVTLVTEDPKVENQQAVNSTEEIRNLEEIYKASQIKKYSESSTTEGFGLVFIDDYSNGIKDTIRLVIPNPKPAVAAIKEEPKEEKKFIEIGDVPKQDPAQTAVVKTIVKNNCTDIATETDFFKLRKKMASANDDDAMIAEAKKYFKTKCFTTSQVKNLGTLFLTDESKYKFFDAGYKYAADPDVYDTLQSELKDEYYTSRFKAMLRN